MWREQRSPASSQHQLASHVSEPPWKWMLRPQLSPQTTAASAASDCNLLRELGHNRPAKLQISAPEKPREWKK